MNKWQVISGILIGLLSNFLGLMLYLSLFFDYKISTSLQMANEQGYLGAIVALGAIPNLPIFFLLLRYNKDWHARGVLIATMAVAVFVFLYKLL